LGSDGLRDADLEATPLGRIGDCENDIDRGVIALVVSDLDCLAGRRSLDGVSRHCAKTRETNNKLASNMSAFEYTVCQTRTVEALA